VAGRSRWVEAVQGERQRRGHRTGRRPDEAPVVASASSSSSSSPPFPPLLSLPLVWRRRKWRSGCGWLGFLVAAEGSLYEAPGLECGCGRGFLASAPGRVAASRCGGGAARVRVRSAGGCAALSRSGDRHARLADDAREQGRGGEEKRKREARRLEALSRSERAGAGRGSGREEGES
jgi:hypothetical protein